MKKWQLVGTTVLGASVLLGACGGNDGGSGDGKDLKGSAKGEGSSTVAPIVEKLNEKWAKDHKDAKISSGQAGTGAGFQKFIAGETDFSDASRPIKDEEKKKLEDKGIKYHEFKIVSVKSVNKIAIVVNIDIAEIMAKIIGTILSLSPPFLALFLAIISLTFVCEAM